MKTDSLYSFLDTPSLVVDLDKMDSNIAEMAALTRNAGVNLRPHTKTHKSIEIARQQIAAGAHGVTVAKVGEAEVMAYAGIKDIRIAYPVCGDIKLARLRHLLEFADISISLDSLEVARGLSELGQAVGKPLPVLLDINVGMNRCGVLPGR